MNTRKNKFFFKNFLVAALLCLPLMLSAQSIQVTNFAIDETDMTANLAESTVRDQNGNKCALIKVHTTQTGFQFDVGMLGVTKQEEQGGKHPTEIWLYVPAGVKRIDIMHQQLGELRNYDLHQELKAAKTYHMTLRTAKVETIINPTLQRQFAVFTLVPANAVIEVDGEAWDVDADGHATRQLPFGTYQYRVSAPRYKPTVGQFTVGKQKYAETITLVPNFSTITFKAMDGAEVWIDGKKRGEGKCNVELVAGEYTVECRKESHVATSKVVNVEPNQPCTIELDAPRPIYGLLSVTSSPIGAKIQIDGKPVGETPLSLENVLIGRRDVSASLKGYSAKPQSVNVTQTSQSSLTFAMVKDKEMVKDKKIYLSEYDRLERKIKKLKICTWVGGGMFVAGIPLITIGAGKQDSKTKEVTSKHPALLITGIGLTFSGGLMALGCFLTTKFLSPNFAASSALYEKEFQLNNGTVLSANVNVLQDIRLKEYAPGIGMRYTF